MKKFRIIGLAIILVLTSAAFTCNSSTKKLALASDSISHALVNAETAVDQAVVSGIISQADADQFKSQLTRVAKAGLVLDNGIRQGESATNLSTDLNAFLDTFNTLQNSGLVGIKNPALKLTISTIITGAESSVAIIQATVGGK